MVESKHQGRPSKRKRVWDVLVVAAPFVVYVANLVLRLVDLLRGR